MRLQNEVNGLVEDPIPGVIVKKLKKPLKPPTAEVHIEGPPNTPYANYDLVIRLSIPDDYPFSPPVVKFAHRILHINVSMMLDGSCSIPQVSSNNAIHARMPQGCAPLTHVLRSLRSPRSRPCGTAAGTSGCSSATSRRSSPSRTPGCCRPR